MLFDKIGLAGSKLDINPEITASDFRVYDYSTKDCSKLYEKYDVLNISINIPFKILNGILFINNIEYDLSDKLLSDVYDIFNLYGTASLFNNYEKFSKLPAVLLCDCSNTFTTTIDGDISPLDISYRQKNFTIESLKTIDSNLTIYDNSSRVKKEFVKKGSRIYYEPSADTKIYVTSLSTELYLRVDFSPRRLSSNEGASYLLNFRRTNEL